LNHQKVWGTLNKHIEILGRLNIDWLEPKFQRIKTLKKVVISNPLLMSAAWSICEGHSYATEEGSLLLEALYKNVLSAIGAPTDRDYESLEEIWLAGDQ
jgi:hypothetical protein